MLGIPAYEITRSVKTRNDMQVKKWVGVESVVFNPRHRKPFVELADAISSVIDISADLPGSESDVPIVANRIVEEDSS